MLFALVSGVLIYTSQIGSGFVFTPKCSCILLELVCHMFVYCLLASLGNQVRVVFVCTCQFSKTKNESQFDISSSSPLWSVNDVPDAILIPYEGHYNVIIEQMVSCLLKWWRVRETEKPSGTLCMTTSEIRWVSTAPAHSQTHRHPSSRFCRAGIREGVASSFVEPFSLPRSSLPGEVAWRR